MEYCGTFTGTQLNNLTIIWRRPSPYMDAPNYTLRVSECILYGAQNISKLRFEVYKNICKRHLPLLDIHTKSWCGHVAMLVCWMMWYCYFFFGFKHDDVIKWKHFPRYWPFVRGNGEFPTQRPVTRSFDIFFDLCLNKRLRKQWWGWWFVTLSRPLWRHRDDVHFNYI